MIFIGSFREFPKNFCQSGLVSCLILDSGIALGVLFDEKVLAAHGRQTSQIEGSIFSDQYVNMKNLQRCPDQGQYN
jgi:hypothetical protein